MAFPINVMAFPINGMAPGLAAAPGHGQVALGVKKVALALGGPAPRHFLGPRRRRQAWRQSINRERHNMNWERHGVNWERNNINWERRGGVGCDGVGLRFEPQFETAKPLVRLGITLCVSQSNGRSNPHRSMAQAM